MKRATDEVTSSALAVKISIHALVKRATDCPTFSIKNGCISIHALVKRATNPIKQTTFSYKHFNPRPREEGDLLFSLFFFCFYIISIHALVKRATYIFADRCNAFNISIHALVKRATCKWRYTRKGSKAISIHALVKRATAVSDWRKGLWQHFNPRLREEGDKSGDTSVKELSYFNPRPREEGDAKGNNIYRTGAISIHALVKRATTCSS